MVDGLNLTQVQLAEVAEVYAEHAGDGVESKGLKVHFQMDDSGLLNLTGVEAVFEKTTGGGAAAEEDESTLAKLSSAFGKLFSGDGEKLSRCMCPFLVGETVRKMFKVSTVPTLSGRE